MILYGLKNILDVWMDDVWMSVTQKRWIFSAVSSLIDLKLSGDLRVGTGKSVHDLF